MFRTFHPRKTKNSTYQGSSLSPAPKFGQKYMWQYCNFSKTFFKLQFALTMAHWHSLAHCATWHSPTKVKKLLWNNKA